MKRKLFVIVSLILVILVGSSSLVAASAPYKSYTYNFATIAPSPVPYEPVGVVDSHSLGVEMKEPQDLFRDKDGNYYIVDAGTNNIIITTSDWKVIKVINKFMNGTKEDTFGKPNGIYVTENGDMYIADTENGRIVILNKDGNLVKVLNKPQSEVFKSDFKYFPRKLVVDSANRIFVVARGVYDGIMELDMEGKFSGFIGSNKVTFSAADMFWKKLYTRAQKEKMVQFIPIEYTNFTLDKSGFMYAVTSADKGTTPIKRLNPSGKDVLRREGITNAVNGDIKQSSLGSSITGTSTFVDICVDEYNVYNALDSKRGRIFSYDTDGNLLYVFGNINTQQIGSFKNPTAIERSGDNLIVADGALARITIFEMTDYARLIRQGVTQYSQGDYEGSIDTWSKVLKINMNFDLGYVQLGKTYLRQEKIKEALDYFTLARYRGSKTTGYSKAYTEYRKLYLHEHFGAIATSLIVLIFAYVIFKRIRKHMSKKSAVWEGGEGL